MLVRRSESSWSRGVFRVPDFLEIREVRFFPSEELIAFGFVFQKIFKHFLWRETRPDIFYEQRSEDVAQPQRLPRIGNRP